jgi:hypothetical protein
MKFPNYCTYLSASEVFLLIFGVKKLRLVLNLSVKYISMMLTAFIFRVMHADDGGSNI